MESYNFTGKDNKNIEPLTQEEELRMKERQKMAEKERKISKKEQFKQEFQEHKKFYTAITCGALLLGGLDFFTYQRSQEVEKNNAEIIKKAKEGTTGHGFIKYVEGIAYISADERSSFEASVKKIEVELGSLSLSEIKAATENEKELQARMPEKPSINGFDQISIDGESLRPILDQNLYPEGFINGNIASVVYVNADGNGGILNVNSHNEITFPRQSLVFFNENNRESKGYFLYAFMHEESHVYDWAHRMNLSPQQRINFLSDVLNAFNIGRKYKTPIPGTSSEEENAQADVSYNKISKNDQKILKQTIKYLTINEWWANLVSGYLEFPLLFDSTASPQEKALIQKWLLGNDKKFNPYIASEKRNKLWDGIHNTTYKKLKAINLDANPGFEGRSLGSKK